jgi:hypothetical protein
MNEKIMLFGASQQGANFCESSPLEIIGFVDNDIKKQGKTFNNLPVHSIQQLDKLNVDRVIITSQYYKEIYQSLITYCNVNISLAISYLALNDKENWIVVDEPNDRNGINPLGFFLHSADMLHHYLPVFEHLKEHSFDIVLFGPKHERQQIRTLSQDKNYNVIDAEIVVMRGQKYCQFVSNHYMYDILSSLSDNHIRFMYSLGAQRHNYAEWNRNYKLILCFGPQQASNVKELLAIETTEIGYPRYDRYFDGKIDKQDILESLKLDLNKETIIWLPTVEGLSSYPLFSTKMSNLSNRYNVVLKPHPLSMKNSLLMERMKALSFSKVITENFDNLHLYIIADYVVCDYGGTAFGALYTDNNLLFLNVPNAEQNELIGEHSPELLLRESIINFSVDDEADFEVIFKNKDIWKKQKRVREKLRQLYFKASYGSSACIAAEAITNFVNKYSDG